MNFDFFYKQSLKTRVTLFTLAIFVAGICEVSYKPNTVEDLDEAVARIAMQTGKTSDSS